MAGVEKKKSLKMVESLIGEVVERLLQLLKMGPFVVLMAHERDETAKNKTRDGGQGFVSS